MYHGNQECKERYRHGGQTKEYKSSAKFSTIKNYNFNQYRVNPVEYLLVSMMFEEFRNMHVYEFLRRSNNLIPIDANMLPIDVNILKEYVQNYDLEDGLSVVSRWIIGIDAIFLQKMLYL